MKTKLYFLSLLAGIFATPAVQAGMPCTLTCPITVTAINDLDECGAAVNYPAPSESGLCTNVVCSPAAGSFFDVGTTQVDCTGEINGACSFGVVVVDQQAPVISCPEDITEIVLAPEAINYPNPTVTDNCPGVISSCAPTSGSTFSIGTTAVDCDATDTAGHTAACAFDVILNQGILPPASTVEITGGGLCLMHSGTVLPSHRATLLAGLAIGLACFAGVRARKHRSK